MKVKSNNSVEKANRIFTDREEPRASFWKMYELVNGEMQTESNVHVLSYYGIGGIGKSTLLKKLIEEMKERLQKPRYIYFDFNLYQESRAVLDKMKNKLAEDYGFSFPLFELGSYVYAKKIGEKADSPEVQKLTDKSPILGVMSSVLGNIPIFDLATKIFEIADESVSLILTHLKQHNRELTQIEYMEAEELYNYLPYLFARDMTNNLSKAKQPLVVFFDTYERLVNELSSVGIPLKSDEWIRSENGIIQNIPNVLWVIAGREKLKWERFDADWSEALEQHILGNLSFADSERFLIGAGVGGAELRKDLYALTNGTPVYLDLCVDQYTRICSNGTVPEIGMFGNNTFDLIERFARYMDSSQKDLVYVLACLQRWSDELAISIASKLLPNFSLSTYEKSKDYSFIIQSDDGYFNIHQTVGDVLLDGCPQIVKQHTAEHLLSEFSERLGEQYVFSNDYSQSLFYIMRAAIIKSRDRQELKEIYKDKVQEGLRKVIKAGLFEKSKGVLEMALDLAKKETDLLYAEVVWDNSILERIKGNFLESTKMAEEALEIYTATVGEDHLDTIDAMSNLADTLSYTTELDRLFGIDTKVFEKRKALLGEDHPETVRAMNKLAVSYELVDKRKQAHELKQQVYEKSRKVFGEDSLETIKAKNNLAISLQKLNETEKAYQLRSEVLKDRTEILGEDHPDTLRAMNNLANTLDAMCETQKSYELKKKVLEKRLAIFGPYHRETISAKNNLANSLEKLGDHQAAYELRKEVYEKRLEIFGENHLETISAASNLSLSLQKMGEHDQEIKLREYAYVKRKEILGEYNIKTVFALESLAESYHMVGQIEKAVGLKEKVIDGYRSVLGEKHRYTISAMLTLADSLWQLKEYEKVREIEEKALELRLETLGEDNLSTVSLMRNLSITLSKLKEYEKAVELKRKVYAKYLYLCGDGDERTIKAEKDLKSAIDVLEVGKSIDDLFNN